MGMDEDRSKHIKARMAQSYLELRSKLISRWKEAKIVIIQVIGYSIAVWQTLNYSLMWLMVYRRGWRTFSVNSQNLDFVCHTSETGHRWYLNKWVFHWNYLQKQASGWISPTGRLRSPGIEYRKVEFRFNGIRCHFWVRVLVVFLSSRKPAKLFGKFILNILLKVF